MTAIVKLEGHLYRIVGSYELIIDLKGDEDIENVIALLNIPASEVGIVMVNCQVVDRKHKVLHDDIITIIPILMGG